MTDKRYYTWEDIENSCYGINAQMVKDGWLPDYIVGITRGGLPIAVMLSNLLGVPCETLKVSLRDSKNGLESNLWMPEDAVAGKKILIVDDINDTGATLNWIKKDWAESQISNVQWDKIWSNNVRFATITENASSEFKGVTYFDDYVDKSKDDVWLVFPWENL